MNENMMNKRMPYGKTPMNLVQITKKQMRKADRHTRHKSVQKHTSLQRDGVEMKNRPQRMTRYLKKRQAVSKSAKDVIRGLKPHWIEDPMMYDMTTSNGGASTQGQTGSLMT